MRRIFIFLVPWIAIAIGGVLPIIFIFLYSWKWILFFFITPIIFALSGIIVEGLIKGGKG